MKSSSVNDLRTYRWRTLDGVEGSILGVYFEEDSWAVKFIEVKADSLVLEDPFLIPTSALSIPSKLSKTIRVNMLSNDLIETSKAYAKVCAVSDTREMAGGRGLLSRLFVGLSKDRLQNISKEYDSFLQDREAEQSELPLEYSKLRKTEEVKGYLVKTPRKRLGKVKDFFISIGEREWKLDRLLILPPGLSFLFGKKILVRPQKVAHISYGDEEILVRL